VAGLVLAALVLMAGADALTMRSRKGVGERALLPGFVGGSWWEEGAPLASRGSTRLITRRGAALNAAGRKELL